MRSLEVFIYLVPVTLASLVLHELAHAVVATALGDPTPRREGRLTLNPIVHLDPLGTLVFALSYFAGGFLFGWAKPVMVQPWQFRRPQQDMALVAVAGPLTNFALALVAIALYARVDLAGTTHEVVRYSVLVNVALGVFNLLPIPPLDGSRIVGAFMNRELYLRWSSFDQYGIFVLLGLFFLFRAQFSTILGGGQDAVLRALIAIVGG